MANVVSERRWLALIFVLYFLLGVGYSLLMPIWEAPDEPAHYHVGWYFAQRNRFPKEEHNYEVVQPHAYYFFSSYVIRALEEIEPRYTNYFVPTEYKHNFRVAKHRFSWGPGNYRFMLGVYVLRWINLVFGALALWIGWKTFHLIIPDLSSLRLAALGFAALTPQYLHIMSSVNNDALGTLAGACLFYLTVRIVKEQNQALAIFPMILAVILPLVTKLTVLPVSAAVLTVIAGKWLFSLRQKRWLVYSGLLFLMGIGILYVLFPEAIQWTWQEISWRLFGVRKRGLSPEYLKLISNQILQTYWGKVGWIAVGLPNWIVYGLTTLGLIGIILKVRRLIREKAAHPEFGAWIAVLLIVSFTALAVARNSLTTGATQGRFLFPAIGALSLLMISGWHEVLPEKFQRNLPLIVTILMVTLTLGLWVLGIIPVYYQPFLD